MKKVFSPILGKMIEDKGQDLSNFGIISQTNKPKIAYVEDKKQPRKRPSGNTKRVKSK
jgi:hypothetical protein